MRLGAVVFVALAITATAMEMTRKGEGPAPRSAERSERAEPDSLREELRRCSHLGETGARDPDCLNAWAENRARFLSPKTSTPQEAR
ncbi:putative entry exclusion protein TrbK-alt [Xanthobacter autotrophicus]|uniref:putative entry exclusion protein TrbK-alt n=1 Tax=Xanthobacter autotrophicus TaxID=280 RepID=UPI00372D40DB